MVFRSEVKIRSSAEAEASEKIHSTSFPRRGLARKIPKPRKNGGFEAQAQSRTVPHNPRATPNLVEVELLSRHSST